MNGLFPVYNCIITTDVAFPLTPTQWLPKPATRQFPHTRRTLRVLWSLGEREKVNQSPGESGRLEGHPIKLEMGLFGSLAFPFDRLYV